MKTKLYSGLVASLLLLSYTNNVSAQTVADWTFETSRPTSGSNIVPEIGAGTFSVYHSASGATYGSPAGNGSNGSFVTAGWSVGDYYMIDLNTVGFSNLAISFDVTGSNKGPAAFQLQASVGGGAFAVLPGTNFTVTNVAWASTAVRGTSFSFALPATLSNQEDVVIRIVDLSTVSTDGTTVIPTGTNRLDNLIIATSVPTPIYFKDFTLTSKGSQNELKWSTGYESNLENFVIESSENGKNFTEVAKVAPFNMTSGSDYSYVDMAAANKQFYRIKSVDKNGAVTLSQTLTIGTQNQNGKALQCILNLNNNTVQVVTDGSYTGMNYSIVNAAGVVVMQQTNMSLSNGINAINVNGLSAGLYFVKCEYGGKMYTFKIVK